MKHLPLRVACWCDVHLLHPLGRLHPALEEWILNHVCYPLLRRVERTGDTAWFDRA